jgi:hypothetical protein
MTTVRLATAWKTTGGAAAVLAITLAGNAGATHDTMDGGNMSIEQNKATARRWSEELWGRGNLAVADEIIARTTSATTLAIRFPRAVPRTSSGS